MDCPDLKTLSGYQDGGLDAETARRVQEHLAECGQCEERFRTLGKLGLFLRIGVGGVKHSCCPSAEEVGMYVSGNVSKQVREQIESHLAECEKCLHEVAVLSEAGFEEITESSPAPTREAMAGFAELGRRGNRNAWAARMATRWVRVAATAAAAIVISLVMTMLWSKHGTTTATGTTAKATEARQNELAAGMVRDGAVMLAGFARERETAAEHTSLVRFARQMRSILHQTEAAGSSPTQERLEMLKEDVLSSGMVNSVEELSSETKDARVQEFLTNSKSVLLAIARMDTSDASNSLIAVANEIQRMNLSEMSRLMELEGGGSLWLTASL